ncbi:MAG: deoxyribose-phosphate aldolase [Bacteroidales bacterium]|jgi:deoxyribose-phosphate aldolase|nr:deoxyribose-phosphate aldolase [Bacteroidales bacterium]
MHWNLNELEAVKANLERWNSPEILSNCIGLMDLTSLNHTDTDSKIKSMVQKVNHFKEQFPNYPQVAAICVYPNFTKTVRETLKDENVKLAVVAGVFPSSQSFPEIKCAECKMASEAGADEIDIVLSLNHFMGGQYEQASEEIKEIKKAAGKAHLKVILESGTLKDPEQIYKASMLAMEAGADFIKTSTGKTEPAATPEAAYVMCCAIKDFHDKTGIKVGFKPAGGIVTPKDAILYYAIVDSVLGEDWLNPHLFRLGASRLANNILSELENQTISYY